MAFRRRRFSRSPRRSGRRVHRSWDTTLFQSPIDATGASSTGQVLTKAAGFVAATGSEGPGLTAEVFNVRRVIYDGAFVVTPLGTTFQQDTYFLAFALIVQDSEDTDTALTSTAVGTLLQGGSERLLYSGCRAGRITESTGTTVNQQIVEPGHAVQFDIKCNAKLRYDQELLLYWQLQFTNSASVSAMSVYAISRVLVTW